MLRSRILHLLPKRLCSNQAAPVTETEVDSAGSILVKKYASITVISINRPNKRNALNNALITDLKKAIDEFDADETVAAGVLCGEGGNFCAGNDFEELATQTDLDDYTALNNITNRYLKKPLIAAINGYAVGLGFDLALWCDMRIVDETAVMGCLGRRFGSSMSEAGIGRLHAMIGFSKTMDLLLSGKCLKSEEALNNGLANRVTSCGTAIGQAFSIAERLSKFPQSGLLKDRAVLYKHNSNIIPLSNFDQVENDCFRHQSQIMKELQRGAKLFTKGAGRGGNLFSVNLWKSVE